MYLLMVEWLYEIGAHGLRPIWGTRLERNGGLVFVAGTTPCLKSVLVVSTVRTMSSCEAGWLCIVRATWLADKPGSCAVRTII